MHVYMHIRINIHKHTHLHSLERESTYTELGKYACIYVRMYVYACIRMYTYCLAGGASVEVQQLWNNTCMHVYIHACIHTYKHTYIHTPAGRSFYRGVDCVGKPSEEHPNGLWQVKECVCVLARCNYIPHLYIYIYIYTYIYMLNWVGKPSEEHPNELWQVKK